MSGVTWPTPDIDPGAVMLVGCSGAQDERVREALAVVDLLADIKLEILVAMPEGPSIRMIPDPSGMVYELVAERCVEVPVFHVDSRARRPARRSGQKSRQHWPDRRRV